MRRLPLLLAVLLLAGTLRAQIAVFPFEDLTLGLNGVNFKVSRMVAKRLEDMGLYVVYPEQVVGLLSEYRVMWTGWVDRVTADRISRRFDARYILLGTVLEYDPKRFAFGVSLRILDVGDYRIVWTSRTFFSEEDKISFLGIGPKGWEFFLAEALDRLLARMPAEELKAVAKAPVMDVSRAIVSPKYSRPGQEVVCKVKAEVSGKQPNKVIFEVEKVGEVVAKREGDFYVAKWISPDVEGRFGVSIEAIWGKKLRKRMFVASYYVDKTPPVFNMKLMGAVNIKGKLVVAKKMAVGLEFERREPIKRWRFRVLSEDEGGGKEVVSYVSMGEAPSKFVWNEETESGPIGNGEYVVELTLWDRAGNSYTESRKVYVVRNLADLVVKAYQEADGIRMKIKLANFPLPISDWRVAVWSEDGEIFDEKAGEGMPREVKFSLKADGNRKLFYTVELMDESGNWWKVDRKPLVLTKVGVKERKKGSGWVDDF